MTTTPAMTTLYFTATRRADGALRVMCHGYGYTDADVREARAWAMRWNTAAARKGDTSKPAQVLKYVVPA